jgi:hypothetical protein
MKQLQQQCMQQVMIFQWHEGTSAAAANTTLKTYTNSEFLRV